MFPATLRKDMYALHALKNYAQNPEALDPPTSHRQAWLKGEKLLGIKRLEAAALGSSNETSFKVWAFMTMCL